MLGDERTKPRKAEHLTLRVVSLYEAVAVEEGCFASFQDGLLLLIAHPRHEAQGHPSGHYLLLLAPFFFLLFALPLFIEPSAVFGAGATFSPSPFRVVSSGTAVGSASGGGGCGT